MIFNLRRGYVLLVAIIVSAVVLAFTIVLFSYLTSYIRTERLSLSSAQALAIANGGIDKAMYELDQDALYTGEANTALGTGTFTTQVTAVDDSARHVVVTATIPNSTNPIVNRVVSVTATVDTSIIAFHYGVQVGTGGLSMSNGSEIHGGVYSAGNISGSGTITGDVTASGLATISGVTINGNATGHTLSSCTVHGNATFGGATTNCSVSGTKYPNSTDATNIELPITDTQISDWETAASTGDTLSGPYVISGTQTLGPDVIIGDLTVTNNAHLILAGPVWVKGNITLSNGSYLQVSAGTGNSGAILLADVMGQETTKGTVVISNNVVVSGNGSVGSFPMILTTNTGSSAITLSNNATSVILYAPYGTIIVSNNAAANQLTAKRIVMSNNSSLDYVAGLQNAGFSNGPGGAWAVQKGTYVILQ